MTGSADHGGKHYDDESRATADHWRPRSVVSGRLASAPAGAGQVRVKAHAIGAGGPDVLIRNGTYKWMPPLPAIPGNELAGIVDAVGPGVSRLSIGDRVLVSARELPQRGAAMRRPSALRSRFRSYFQTPLPSMMQ
jgi:NADPH:quinone reductase-like Zn-dependent oxidoreductase